MLVDLPVKDFIQEVAKDSPAPGGGSVAALAGAISAALVSMVANLTIGREKYKEQEEELIIVREKAAVLQEKLTHIVDEDTQTFNLVMNAYKMPKTTEEEKTKRTQAIQEALKRASELPMEAAECSLEAMKLVKVVVEKGNPNCISDAGVGCLMAEAGLKGALFNVEINIGSIKDEEFKNQMQSKVEQLSQEAQNLSKEIIQMVKRQF
ncbi:MAG: cyclodeaminase/cyclohydrolase family protein [Bacillota bacterium]